MKIMCWLGWHRWNSLTAWPWQQFCTRCGVCADPRQPSNCCPPDRSNDMPHPNDPLVWEYELTGMDKPAPPNPHYHCSTLDSTPCPTGEHRNPATPTPNHLPRRLADPGSGST